MASSFYIDQILVDGDVILSPMDGYSDQPFRALCRTLGSAASYTEFVRAEDVLANKKDIPQKLSFEEAERPVIFQLYGEHPETMLEAGLRLQALQPDAIDINMGCPAKKISNRGAGVGLMRTPPKIGQIFQTLCSRLEIPLTGKMRLGWDEEHLNYLEVAHIVEENGGKALAVHGRTRQMGYRGQANWDAIAEVVHAVGIPVIGNGDVRQVADIQRMKAHTDCAAVMIGRAAMQNPWIFAGLDRDQVSVEQLRNLLQDHLARNLSFYGPRIGLVLFRKFATRYLEIPREMRRRMLTTENAAEFLDMVEQVISPKA